MNSKNEVIKVKLGKMFVLDIMAFVLVVIEVKLLFYIYKMIDLDYCLCVWDVVKHMYRDTHLVKCMTQKPLNHACVYIVMENIRYMTERVRASLAAPPRDPKAALFAPGERNSPSGAPRVQLVPDWAKSRTGEPWHVDHRTLLFFEAGRRLFADWSYIHTRNWYIHILIIFFK